MPKKISDTGHSRSPGRFPSICETEEHEHRSDFCFIPKHKILCLSTRTFPPLNNSVRNFLGTLQMTEPFTTT
jgi:hypothetical protein